MKKFVATIALALIILVPASKAQDEKSSGVTLRDLLHTWFPSYQGDNEEDGDTTPAGLESEASDLLGPKDFLSEEELRHALPWRGPDYSNQSGSLGWNETIFETPPGLKDRVAFWKQIYTKYTTNQGVIHDRDDVSIIYETVDFASIMNDSKLGPNQKARNRERLVNQKRDEITQILNRLQERYKTNKTSDGLAGNDLKYWNLWLKSEEADKYKSAAEKGRLRFQLGQKDRFIVGIYHSGRYLRQMEQIFREEKMPVELTRLPFVESSFNIRARSKVGASGIWQFMRRTARPFMKVNREVDERNDPLKATKASARLLKSNYGQLRDWPLAITGYNHGPNGVAKIAAKVKTKDLSQIIERYSSRSFGFASANFYACFLAALDAEKNAKTYFGDVKWGPEMDGVEIKLQKPVAYKTVLQFYDDDDEAAELANFHIMTRVKNGKDLIPRGTFIRVPSSRAEIAKTYLAGKLPPSKLALELKQVPLGKPAEISPPAQAPVLPEPQLTSGEPKP